MSNEKKIYEWLAALKGTNPNYNADPPPGAIPFLKEQSILIENVAPPVPGEKFELCVRQMTQGEVGFVQRIRITGAGLYPDGSGGFRYTEWTPQDVQGKFFARPSVGGSMNADMATLAGGVVDSNTGGISTVGDFGTLTRLAPIPVFAGATFSINVTVGDMGKGASIPADGAMLTFLVQGYTIMVPGAV